MNAHRSQNEPNIWIVFDEGRVVLARIKGGSREEAVAVAKAFYPELEAVLSVEHHRDCRSRECHQAKHDALQLTPALCAKIGASAPRSELPSVKLLAERLQKRFTRAAGGVL